MRKDCPCQGTNENCYRCDGKGYYDEKDLQPLTRIPFAKGRAKENLSNKKKVCPHCGEEIFASRINSHIFEIHGITTIRNKPAKPKTAATINRKYLIKCPQCKSMVRNDRLKKHIIKVHDKLSDDITINKIYNSLKKPKVDNFTNVKCPKCNTIVRRDELNVHINDFHNKLAPNKPNKTSNIEKYKDSLLQYSSHVTKDNDGSKGLHIYREDGGKFGSHPSFDDMDDESFPD